MAVNVTDELRLYDRLRDKQGAFPDLWQEIADYILPGKAIINSRRTVGFKSSAHIFDSTAIKSNQVLAATMHGSMTSGHWFSLRERRKMIDSRDDVREWLEECEDRMYLSRRQSNFEAEIAGIYSEVAPFGTGAMLIEEREDDLARKRYGDVFRGFHYRALSISEYVIDEAADGKVNTLLRKFELSASEMVKRWGEQKVGDTIKGAARDDPSKPFEILHGVRPRRVQDRSGGKMAKTALPYSSCYIAVQSRHLLQEGGYHEFPYVVPRWAKTPGEIWGRGPGDVAIPTIRTLNQAIYLMLRGAAKAIAPPWMATSDGVIGELRTAPDQLTIVESMDALRPIESVARFDVAQLIDQRMANQIREIFFWDQLQLVQGKQMTATEVERRWDLMRRILGPTLGRLETELYNPMIRREFALMLRAGALPDMPDVLVQLGPDLDIEYEGPLARSQKSIRVTAFMEWLQTVGLLAQFDPTKAAEALDHVETDVAIRELAEITGVPSAWLRSQEQIDEIRAQRQEAQRKQAETQGIMQAVEAAGKGAPALKALGDLSSRLGGGGGGGSALAGAGGQLPAGAGGQVAAA